MQVSIFEAKNQLSALVAEAERGREVESADLAARFRLSVCDASYLELALRRGLPLATTDRGLRSAAEASGVALLP